MAFELNQGYFNQVVYDLALEYSNRFRVMGEREPARGIMIHPFDVYPERYVYEWYVSCVQYVEEYRPEGFTFDLGNFNQRYYNYVNSYISRFRDEYIRDGVVNDEILNDVSPVCTTNLRFYNYDTYLCLLRHKNSMYPLSDQYRFAQRVRNIIPVDNNIIRGGRRSSRKTRVKSNNRRNSRNKK